MLAIIIVTAVLTCAIALRLITATARAQEMREREQVRELSAWYADVSSRSP